MASLNTLQCAINVTGGNTDIGSCFFDYQPIIGMFLSYGKYLSASELADLQASLNLAVTASNLESKLFPFFGIEEAEDEGTEPQSQTTQYGTDFETSTGKSKHLFRFVKGGLCLHKKIVKHQDCTQWYLVDAKNRLLGWSPGDGSLHPFDLNQIRTNKRPLATPSALPFITISGSYSDESQLIQNAAWASADTDNFLLKSIKGMQDVHLIVKAAITNAGLVKVSGTIGCASMSLRSLTGAALANEEAWIAYRKDTGAPVTISTAAEDGITDGYALTLDEAAIPTGTKIGIRIGSMAVLSAAPVNLPPAVKIESDEIVVTTIA